ncbi:MAG: restriction endonuclease subunit S [Candidatus Bathyarchaeia archaeon]
MNFERESQFKETEIGILPKDWNLITLKDACSKIGSGITPRGGADVYSTEGTALIRSQNVLNNSFSREGLAFLNEDLAGEMENVTVANRDVLLNITGDSVARCCNVPDNILPARVNQHVSIIRANEKILDPLFLKYYLTSPKVQNYMLSLAQSGGTRNALTKGMIENFVIPKPDMSEQKSIAYILSSLDSKIELNRCMDRTLEAVGGAVFKRWFVDFEFPNQEGKPYKSSGGKMAYTDIGEIPKDWKMSTIRKLASSVNYGYTQSASSAPVGPKFLRITDIQGGKVDWDEVPYCEIDQESLAKYSIKSGDVLVARTGASTGENVYIEDCPASVFASYLIRIRFADKNLARYIAKFMRSPRYQDYILNSIGGSAQPNANAITLTDVQVPVPQANILEKFGELAGVFEVAKYANTKESNTLATIRNLLLPKLMSGKIRVPTEKQEA